MNRRRLGFFMALILCGCLLSASALGDAADAQNTAAQNAVPAQDTTIEDYVQQLFPGHTLTEAEAEAVQVLHGFTLEILAFEKRVDEADASDLKLVHDLLREEEALEDRLDAYEDMLEASYRADAFERMRYRVLDDELERLDDRLDHIEDALERYWDD